MHVIFVTRNGFVYSPPKIKDRKFKRVYPRSVLGNTYEMLKTYNLTYNSRNVFESLQVCTEIISL